MDVICKKNLKIYKQIVTARKFKNRIIWTLCTVISVLLVMLFAGLIVSCLNFGYFFLIFLIAGIIDFLLIYYYFYIQFIAKCYKCCHCGKKFVVSFREFIIKDIFFMRFVPRKPLWLEITGRKIQKLGTHGRTFNEFKVKCPYCKKKLFWMDNLSKF